MKKKILSLVLCLAMLLSLGSLMISAEKVDGTTGSVMYANYGTISVDGTIDNAMQMDTLPTTQAKGVTYGATWDADYLYFGVAGITVDGISWGGTALSAVTGALTPIKSFSVALENGSYSVTTETGATTGEGTVAGVSDLVGMANNSVSAAGRFFAEIAIPMDQVVLYDLGNGYIGTNVKLAVNSDAGAWINFLGVVALCDTAQVEGYDVSGAKNYDIVNGHDRVGTDAYYMINGTLTRAVGGQISSRGQATGIKGIACKYFPDATQSWPSTTDALTSAGAEQTLGYIPLYYAAATTYLPTSDLVVGKHIVAQQDIKLSGLPVADLSTVQAEKSTGAWSAAVMESNATNPGRALLTVGMGTGNCAADSNGYVIYNTADGLVIMDDLAINSIALGVEQGVFFNLRLEVDANRNTDVYVNGRKVGTLPASTNQKAFVNGVLFDGGLSTSVTVGNSIGTGSVSAYVRNAYVAQESDAAVAALATLKARVGEVSFQTRLNAEKTAYDVRFLVELSTGDEADLAAYKEIGYDLVITNSANQTATANVVVTKVFDVVVADGQYADPDGFVAAAVVKGLPTNADYTFTVKPYVIFDNNQAGAGEKVYFDTADLTLTFDGSAMVKA